LFMTAGPVGARTPRIDNVTGKAAKGTYSNPGQSYVCFRKNLFSGRDREAHVQKRARSECGGVHGATYVKLWSCGAGMV
jgi:hypothetical protein